MDITAFNNYDREIDFFYLMMLFQWINLLGGHTLIYMTTYDNEVDLDDTYENVMDNTHLDNTTSLSSPNDQTKNDITRYLSLDGIMMSTSRANIDETFVIGRRSLEGTSPSVKTHMLMANLMGGGHGDNSSDGGGGSMGGEGGGSDRGGGNLRLLGGACDVGPDGVLLMPGTMVTIFVNGIEGEAVTRPDESIHIHPRGQSPRSSVNNNESINEFGAMDQDYEDDNDGVGFEMYDNGENCSNSNNREDSEETMVDDATVDACN